MGASTSAIRKQNYGLLTDMDADEGKRELRVLIIEDDEVDRRSFTRLNTRELLGYHITEAASVAEAKAALAANVFDAVVLDYSLGDGTAFDVFAMQPDAPVIVATGMGDESTAVALMKAGAYDYVVKDHERNYLRGLPGRITAAIQRKQQDEQLQILSHSVISAGDCIIVTRPDDTVFYVNPAFCAAYGYAPEEVYGKSTALLWQNQTEYAAAVTHDGSKQEAIHLRKDGSAMAVLLGHSFITDTIGKRIAAAWIAADITEKKNAEDELRNSRARLQDAQSIARLGNFVWYPATNQVWWGTGTAMLFGSAAAPMAFSADALAPVMHAEDIPVFTKAMQLCAEQGIPVNLDFRLTAAEGSHKIVHVRAGGAKETTTGAVPGTMQDVTERKAMEHELRLLNESKDKFFSIISHDLKSAFGGVLSFSELLYTDYDTLTDKERREFLSILSSSARSTYSLITNLLHWSMLQRGLLEFRPEPFRVQRLLQEAEQSVHLTLRQKNIAYHAEVEDGLLVLADVHMMASVLRNLLSNAAKFTPEHGFIEVTAHSRHGKSVITVTDSGTGMEPEVTAQLFLRQSPGKAAAKEAGTGLGLLLCKEFIDKCGGTIAVSSTPGKGTVFTIAVPAP